MSEFEKWIESMAAPGNRLHEPGMWSALEKAFEAGYLAGRAKEKRGGDNDESLGN